MLSIAKKIEALVSLTSSSDFSDYFSTFKRVANITKDVNLEDKFVVDTTLLVEEAEKVLYEKFKNVMARTYVSYEEELDVLFGLRDVLENFFDKVMVNAENELVRNNRKALIGSIYQSLARIADIKLLSM